MNDNRIKLVQIQKLIIDMLKVNRNHRIPGTERRENVIEHSFSIAMLCWNLHRALKSDLSLEKILLYSLAHDFSERGQEYDTNTYANASDRLNKKKIELNEFKKLSKEFNDFEEMINVLSDYENLVDEEARFVWCVDKMQAILLGEIDEWRPYEIYGVTYDQFCKKGNEFIAKCPESLKETFEQVFRYGCKTYYDQPIIK